MNEYKNRAIAFNFVGTLHNMKIVSDETFNQLLADLHERYYYDYIRMGESYYSSAPTASCTDSSLLSNQVDKKREK